MFCYIFIALVLCSIRVDRSYLKKIIILRGVKRLLAQTFLVYGVGATCTGQVPKGGFFMFSVSRAGGRNSLQSIRPQ